MTNLVTRTAKLTPRPKRIINSPGLATAYIYEPESIAAHGLGGLYVVIEVVLPSRPAQSVVDTVIETVGTQYYNWEPTKPVPALERFERAVKATNAALAKEVAGGNAGWIGRISAIIALLEGDELHITQTGSAEAFLYRGNVASHITDSSAKPANKPGSTFGSIASGNVQVNDRLLLTTPAVTHAISRAELKMLITDNSAGATVRKLSEQITELPDTDRMAAIVVEITSSDLLAVSVRDDEPDGALVGQPEKPVEIAKAAAIPAAKKLTETGKQVGQKVSAQAKHTIIPRLRESFSLFSARIARDIHNASGRRQLAFAAAATLIALAVIAGLFRQQSTSASAVKQYDSAYSDYSKALSAQQSGDKATAKALYIKSKKTLDTLAKDNNVSSLNKTLAHHSHPEEDPASVTVLLVSINDRVDELDNLVRVEGTVLVDLAQYKNAKPAQIVSSGNKLIIVDANNGSAVYLYDLTTKQVVVANKPTDVGKIVAATASANNDGAYVITSEPAVWFIKAFDGSFVSQDISFGDWPKAKSLANYASNLYLLSADGTTVTKHIKTAAGFAAGADYFKDPSVVDGASSIAVDGSIYLGGGSNVLARYLSGTLNAKATDVPDTLKRPLQIVPIESGTLLTFDGNSHRVGIFNNSDSGISFTKQLVFKLGETNAATADSSGSTIFAAVGAKIVSTPLP